MSCRIRALANLVTQLMRHITQEGCGRVAEAQCALPLDKTT